MLRLALGTVLLMAFNVAACGDLIKQGKGSRPTTFIDETTPVSPDEIESAARAEDATANPAEETPSSLSGKELYGKLCASCHAVIEESAVARASLEELKVSIINIAVMNDFKNLTDIELNSLVEALSKIPPGKGKVKPIP